MIYLGSNRLRVEIASPEEVLGRTCRFSRAGFVTEITLDGIHRFCASEPENLVHPSTGGRGLCDEYLCDLRSDVDVGGFYPKFGVGLIQKEREEDEQFLRRSARKVVPFPVHASVRKDRAIFVTEPLPCLAYALREAKEISVRGRTVTMRIRAENTGRRRIVAREYCHNMLTIDGMALGPDYTMEMPDIVDRGRGMVGVFIERDRQRRETRAMIQANGRGFTFARYQPFAEVAYIEREEITSDDAFRWKYRNAAGGVFIRQTDRYKPERVVLWAADHICSVESMKGIDLLPGESDEWTRTWTFGKE